MRKFLVQAALILMVSISTRSYGQLWRQYLDSARLFEKQRQAEKTVDYYYRAYNILKKDSLGTESHGAVANSLAGMYWRTGQIEKAIEYALEAYEIAGKATSKVSRDYGTICHNLGMLYIITGNYKKAETFYLEAKQIREKVLGKDHFDYALTCNGLGLVYSVIGQYTRSEAFYQEARDILKKAFPAGRYFYALTCSNYAALLRKQGFYEKAEPLFLEAKEIYEKILGKDDPDYAGLCINLANTYTDIGQYDKAMSLYNGAGEVMKKKVGKEHPDYISFSQNLGRLYALINRPDSALLLFFEAKNILEKTVGKSNHDYAVNCNTIARLYLRQGKYKESETFFQEALAIFEEIMGKNHPEFTTLNNDLADFYLETGNNAKALELLMQAKAICDSSLSKLHPNYLHTCVSIGNLYTKMNSPEKAQGFYAAAFGAQQGLIKKIFQFTSETEKNAYLKTINYLDEAILHLNMMHNLPANTRLAYNVSILKRNLVLSSIGQIRETAYRANDTAVKNKYDSWIDYKEQLAFWYSKPVSERPADIKDLENNANFYEKELTRLLAVFKKDESAKEVTWKDIQQALKSYEAAIEFVNFTDSSDTGPTEHNYYIALILRKDRSAPELVKLFEKKKLDELLRRQGSDAHENINKCYAKGKIQSVYDIIWQPVEKYLEGITKVYFAPAGDLHKIAFAALPVNDKQVLSDKYQLVQLNTTAAVTINAQNYISPADKLQLYGGINYDADSSSLSKTVISYRPNDITKRSLPGDLDRGAGFQFLPGARKETEEIKKQADTAGITVSLLSGNNAVEESFKALNGKASPSILHIATHGFFFPDPKDDERDEFLKSLEKSGKPFRQSDNPLFRSGLAFAGANNAWKGKPIDGIEDGILTAYEVSNMYLPNTKLVMLSACETALGDIQGSEGVYGLQRAFKMTGVQNLIMSLWKVPDAETAEFMQLFYKSLFGKQTISNAFYNAQQIMKNKYRAEPYKWAAWVLVR